MPLADGQVQVRNLVMGPGTDYVVMRGFDPWSRTVRADQSGDRPWGHGGWSGAEWANAPVSPVPVFVEGATETAWRANRDALAAAFSAVGDTAENVELRFAHDGTEYVLFGRPRADQSPDVRPVGAYSLHQCGFAFLNPLIYSGVESTTGAFGLPTFTGGLTVPFAVPFAINASAVDGEATAENVGTADTGLTLRIDGPVSEPRVTVQRPDGDTETVRYGGDVPSGRFVVLDTAARTALLDGLPQASRRGQVSGVWPLLPPGESMILFRSSDVENASAQLTATWRSAWW